MSATRPRRGPGLAMSGIPRFRSGLDGIVWPPVPVGEAATIAASGPRLQASERLPLAEIEAAQGAQLARLAAHHGRHSPAFRARLAAARLAAARSTASRGCASCRRCRAEQLQAAGKDFFAAQVPRGHEPIGEVTTSGSTGEPVKMRRPPSAGCSGPPARSATISGTAAISPAA